VADLPKTTDPTPPNAGIKLSGQWRCVLYNDKEGVKQIEVGPNVVCTNGKDFLASFLQSAAAAASTFTCRYVAIGTDSTAAAVGNTTLGTESARVSGVVSYVSGGIYRVTGTFPSGTGTAAIVEYGLLSSSTGGTLFNRTVRSAINKGANDTLEATIEVTLS
jgi:hypothetical protein